MVVEAKDFKEFIGLKLVDIGEGLTKESIAFIFEDKKGKLKGFKILPKDINQTWIETYKIIPVTQQNANDN